MQGRLGCSCSQELTNEQLEHFLPSIITTDSLNPGRVRDLSMGETAETSENEPNQSNRVAGNYEESILLHLVSNEITNSAEQRVGINGSVERVAEAAATPGELLKELDFPPVGGQRLTRIMEARATGTTSKLEQLLTAGKPQAQRDFAEIAGTSSASVSAAGVGSFAISLAADEESGSPGSGDAVSDRYRNPRKRLLQTSASPTTPISCPAGSAGPLLQGAPIPNDQPDKTKEELQLGPVNGKDSSSTKTDASTRDNTRQLRVREKSGPRLRLNKSSSRKSLDEPKTKCSPASLKVAPIILKKYYPSAVESAEFTEFLDSLSEDDSLDEAAEDKVAKDTTKNANMKPNEDLEYMGAQIDKLLNMPSPKSSWKTPKRQRRHQCKQCPKSYSTEDDLKSHELSHMEGDVKIYPCEHCDKKFKWMASLKVHMKKVHKLQPRTEDETDSAAEEESSIVTSPENNSATTRQSGNTVDLLDGDRFYPCEHCDKKFKWATSLKVHVKKVHKLQPRAEDDMDSAEEESSVVTSPENNLATTRQSGIVVDHAKKTLESAFSMISSDIISKNGTHEKAASIVASSRRQRVARTETETPPKKILPPRKSMSTKASPTNKKEDSKSNNIGAKKVASTAGSTEEVVASPPTPTSRTSLRRNIQRPKWLTDADLVTDYEFPRGTNAMRSGGNGPSSAGPGSVANGNLSGRSAPTPSEPPKPIEETPSLPRSQKKESQKTKGQTRNRAVKAREEIPPGIKKLERRKKSVQKNKSPPTPNPSKKEHKRKRSGSSSCGDASADQKGTKAESSPCRGLSTKILIMSLGEEGEENTTSSDKCSSKRPAPFSFSTQSKEENAADEDQMPAKRRRSMDSEAASSKDTSADGTTTIIPENAPTTNSRKLACKEDPTTTSVDTKLKEEVVTKRDEPENEQEKSEIAASNESTVAGTSYSKSDTTDAKKIMDSKIICAEAFPPPRIFGINIPVQCDVNNGANSTGSPESIDKEMTSENVNEVTLNSLEIPNETPVNSNASATTIGSPVNSSVSEVGRAALFPEVNNNPSVKMDPVVVEAVERPETEANMKKMAVQTVPVEEPGSVERTVKMSEEASKTLPSLPSNDEDMPILKPQTSSSVVGSRSNSASDRLKSVDEEDVSNSNSNSNHSTIPSAPVLLKEATTFEDKVPRQSPEQGPSNKASMATVEFESDAAAALDKLPYIDEDDEDNVIRRTRRDRSDSLSMRSCGSGSQSEKIKGLEEPAAGTHNSTKEDEDCAPNDNDNNECLTDSDSNDSLWSEFSELAAQVSENTDGVKFKEDCIRFIKTKVSANSMWLIRKELKKLKKEKNYFKFGKLTPLAAGLMHDLFCQSLR